MVKWVAPPRRLPKAPPPHNLEGVKAALPKTQKQTQGGCQIEETKKYGLTERTEQNSRKRTKQNRDIQPIRCRVQTLVIRTLRELTEHGNNVKEEVKLH